MVEAGGELEFAATTAGGTPVTYTISPVQNTTTHTLAAGLLAANPAERTLRAFPPSGGCYSLAVAPGNYSVRLGLAYYNYDKKNLAPSMLVGVQGTLVDQVVLGDWEAPPAKKLVGMAPTGGGRGSAHFTEYVGRFPDGNVTVCVTSMDGISAPIINSIELMPYRPNVIPEMDLFLPNVSVVLSLKHRMNLGGPDVVADPLRRKWHGPGVDTMVTVAGGLPKYRNITSAAPVTTRPYLKNDAPPPVPQAVFQTAVQGGPVEPGFNFLGVRMRYYPADASNLLLARMYYNEPNPNVKMGQRVFNISFGSPIPGDPTSVQNVPWSPFMFSLYFDIFAAVSNKSNTGFYLAQAGCYQFPLAQGNLNTLYVFLTGEESPLPPIISGIELYEIVVTDPTVPPPCVTVLDANTAPSPNSSPSPREQRPRDVNGPIPAGSSRPIPTVNPTNQPQPGAPCALLLCPLLLLPLLLNSSYLSPCLCLSLLCPPFSSLPLWSPSLPSYLFTAHSPPLPSYLFSACSPLSRISISCLKRLRIALIRIPSCQPAWPLTSSPTTLIPASSS